MIFKLSQVTPMLTKLKVELGAKDTQRVDQIMTHIHSLEDSSTKQLNLSTLLTLLYGDDSSKSMGNFRVFRSSLKNASKELGLEFELQVDRHKQTPATQRYCHFEGEYVSSDLAEYTRQSIHTQILQNTITPKALSMEKQTVKYTILHHPEDSVDEFVEDMNEKLSISAKFDFQPTQPITPTNIAQSQQEKEQIDKSDLLIVLLTPKWLANISTKDNNIVSHKRTLFVEYDEILPTYDRGLYSPYPLFKLNNKSYMDSGESKKEFRNKLIENIDYILSNPTPKRDINIACIKNQKEYIELDISIPPKAQPLSLKTTTQEDLSHYDESRAVDIVPELKKWATTPDSEPFCALFGEYGMGKTITTMLLAKELIDDTEAIECIYIDLRLIGKIERDNIKLEYILSQAISKNHQLLRDVNVTADMIIDAVQQRGGLVIFDGLDEVLVHIDTSEGQEFIRELWRILPPVLRTDPNPHSGKMLLSCRSHYFRDIKQQRSMMLGEDREQLEAEEYKSFVMLPFSDEQIENYLYINFPKRNVKELLEMIRSIHNLPELTRRPFNLSMIKVLIPEIEQMHLDGQKIQGVTLYQKLVRKWLERDGGKHQFTTRHKEKIMSHLAVYMWQEQTKQLPIDELEDWLDIFLSENNPISSAYTKDREILQEDLRTATFVVRQDDENFSFAHSSIQEYFIAYYIYESLLLGDKIELSSLALPNLSPETIAFASQLITIEAETRRKAKLSKALNTALATYTPHTSELILSIYQNLHNLGDSYRPSSIDMRGAKLNEWRFQGSEKSLLSLRGADFSGAVMIGSTLEYCDISSADFSDARLSHSEILECDARQSHYSSTQLNGVTFRHTSLRSARFDDESHLYGVKFIECQEIELEKLPQNQQPHIYHTHPPKASHFPPHTLEDAIALSAGHNGSVTSVAFSPDGEELLSGSDDNSLILWDRESGEMVKRFEGHSGTVDSVAFSADGEELLSGSHDNSLILWDRESGEMVRRFEGHSSSVTSVAFSPDGEELVSGSDDNSLILWDRESGQMVKRFEGHSSRVNSVAFSPDGEELLSGSSDSSLILWDRKSREMVKRFEGHSDWVNSVAFSPDGEELVSGSGDNSLILWDRKSREMVKRFEGHSSRVLSVAFSPDGEELLSGSSDNSLILWDRESGQMVKRFEGHSNWVNSVAFSPDGEELLSGYGDRSLILWDRESGEIVKRFEGHSKRVNSVAFSPDGEELLSGSYDNSLILWDRESGEIVRRFVGHSSRVLSVAFSPDGEELVSGSMDNSLILWDRKSGEMVKRFVGHSDWVNSVAFSPNGEELVSGSDDRSLILWDRESGEIVKRFEGHSDRVASVAFSQNGEELVSGSDDNSLILWDRESGEMVKSFEGHSNWVTSVAFSPDEEELVSGSWDSSLILWDRESGQTLERFCYLPRGQYATIDRQHNRVLSHSESAWRYLRWMHDGQEGRVALPFESVIVE